MEGEQRPRDGVDGLREAVTIVWMRVQDRAVDGGFAADEDT